MQAAPPDLISGMFNLLFEQLRRPLHAWGQGHEIACLLPRDFPIRTGQEFRLGNQGQYVSGRTIKITPFIEKNSGQKITVINFETIERAHIK
jgi:hypothetical protein